MTRLRLAIVGDGKMGRAVRDLAGAAGFDVVAFLGEQDVSSTGPTSAQLAGAQVAIEFTVPLAAAANVLACVKAGVPVVCGTTGWDADRARVEASVRAAGGAMFWSPNFSVGVHLFVRMVERAAAELAVVPGLFDMRIVETSGTRPPARRGCLPTRRSTRSPATSPSPASARATCRVRTKSCSMRHSSRSGSPTRRATGAYLPPVR